MELIAALWIVPIIGLLIIETNENNSLKILGIAILDAYLMITIGTSSGIDFSFLTPILGLMFLPLLIYYFLSFIITGTFLTTTFKVSAKVRKFMDYVTIVFLSLLMLYQSYNLRLWSGFNSDNTWNDAAGVAMQLFLETINLIAKFMGALGGT